MKLFKPSRLMKNTQLCALGRPGEDVAIRHLRTLRQDKMDKPGVALVSLQKSGSTLLSYCCALLNTDNTIQAFRNDFDLLPMLSFPASIIPQNFNARQDGVCQMYKINGHLGRMTGPLTETGIRNVIWMCREFSGYYASVFRWLNTFYCRVNPALAALGSLEWAQYKKLTFEAVAADHVDELWGAFQMQKAPGENRLLLLSYEQLTEQKRAVVKRIADWLGLPCDSRMLDSIDEKTSKQAMSSGERFDPLAFGEGGGVSKVNLKDYPHQLTVEETLYYDERFAARFSASGIRSYRELIDGFDG